MLVQCASPCVNLRNTYQKHQSVLEFPNVSLYVSVLEFDPAGTVPSVLFKFAFISFNQI